MNQTANVSIALPLIAEFLDDMLEVAAGGQRVPWVLVLQTDGAAQYISNTDRKDGKELIESLLERWKAGRADIPAHYNPDLKSAKPR